MADGAGGVTVTTGGSGQVVVVTEELSAEIHRLATAAHDLALERGVLRGIEAEFGLAATAGLELPPAAHSVSNSVDAALRLLELAERRTRELHDALGRCLTVYEVTEQTVQTAWHQLTEFAMWSLGQAARVVALPMLVDLAAGVLISSVITGETPAQQAAALGDYVEENPGLITNPQFVASLREALTDSGEFGAGLAGIPFPLSEALGGDGLGVTGLTGSAAAVSALGSPFGLLRETGVTVRQASSSESTVSGAGGAVSSLAERAQRIPSAAAGEPQIRIDRYSQPEQPDRFEVYIGGTVTFDPVTGSEPFDLTSDITGVAQESPAAYRAVEQAMKDAGVTSSTPVVVTGYSEGGLVASLVASSGHYDVKGIVTFGAPSGQVPIAASVPVLTVRHTTDLVPATGGYDVNPHAVIVSRDPFAVAKLPTDVPVPAHQLKYYEQTSALADVSTDPLLHSTLTRLDGFASGATSVRSTLWLATRVRD